jgi:hypothetical protein
MPENRTHYKELRIHNNHGTLILKDVTITKEPRCYSPGHEFMAQIATGTVAGGGQTSRLFHATHFKPYPVGERMSYEIARRRIDEHEGIAHVDVCYCG